MRTYRELFVIAEFRVLFGLRCLVMASVALGGLALGTITYAETGSTVLTALALFGGPLVTLLGSATVLGASDSLRPRTGVAAPLVVAVAANSLQAVPGLPWPVRFVLLAGPHLVNAATSGSTNRMLVLVVPEEGFVLGRATLNVAVGLMQVVGYAAGGSLLLVLSPTGIFLLAAGLAAAGVLLARFGFADHPASVPHRGLVRRTRAVNRLLLGSPTTRPIYLALWVPNGLVVGCEALYLPLAGASGAGYLFAAGAAGMLGGDVAVGRWLSPSARERLLTPLRLLLAAPYLAFVLGPPLPVALVLVGVASVGYSASLPLQERIHTHADEAVQGQAFGLAGSGMMVGQAVGALVGGGVAEVLPVGLTMTLLAAGSVTASLVLSRGLARSAAGRIVTRNMARPRRAGP